MVSMASNLMLADERVLWMAQREAMACSRIISCLQKIAVYRLVTLQGFSLVSEQTPILFTHPCYFVSPPVESHYFPFTLSVVLV